MSMLSNSNYDQLTHSILQLKTELEEESLLQERQHTLLTVKLQFLQEQLQHSSQNQLQHQRESQNRVDMFALMIKDRIKEMKDCSRWQEEKEQLDKSFKELAIANERLTKYNNHLHLTLAQKIEADIDALNQRLLEKIEERQIHMADVEKTLKREIQLTAALFKDIPEDEERQMEEMLSLMQTEFKRKLGQLRSRRRERKQKFLQLLQTIVEKCRESQQNEDRQLDSL